METLGKKKITKYSDIILTIYILGNWLNSRNSLSAEVQLWEVNMAFHQKSVIDLPIYLCYLRNVVTIVKYEILRYQITYE